MNKPLKRHLGKSRGVATRNRMVLIFFLFVMIPSAIQVLYEGTHIIATPYLYYISLKTTEHLSWFSNISGVTLERSQGDPMVCSDVIYLADNRLPTDNTSFVTASWEALSYTVQTFPAFKQTCIAFFHVSTEVYSPWKNLLHPVWGRLEATAIAMNYFPKASYFLYMDSDAILASPKFTPTSMYSALAYDGKGENATFKTLSPSLIVNKPYYGWLCGECEVYGLGHNCINSGALLWRRSNGVWLILKAWWESRLDNSTQNFFSEIRNEYFHGWGPQMGPHPYSDKMSEQNRLMYITATNSGVNKAVWIVPREVSPAKSSSCPDALDEAHTPCLQIDAQLDPHWNSSGWTCFINHSPDDKNLTHTVSEMIRGGVSA